MTTPPKATAESQYIKCDVSSKNDICRLSCRWKKFNVFSIRYVFAASNNEPRGMRTKIDLKTFLVKHCNLSRSQSLSSSPPSGQNACKIVHTSIVPTAVHTIQTLPGPNHYNVRINNMYAPSPPVPVRNILTAFIYIHTHVGTKYTLKRIIIYGPSITDVRIKFISKCLHNK